jgi:F-type H+-transporting ATPase subunit delta
MRTHILVKRYAQGLAGALRDEAEFELVAEEIGRFRELATGHKEFSEALANPFVAAKKKNRMIKDVLAVSSFSEKTSRFLLLLLAHHRLGLLEGILQALPILWNERKGVSTFEVSSVVSLTEVQKKRLEAELERLESRPVSLHFLLDPGLVAGISLKKGNFVYDASLRGQLEKIKEKIIEG